jgi:O-antigen/teichoic acid export membrane protein
MPLLGPPDGLSDPVVTQRRGGALYLVASLISQVAGLLRYVALARLLGPEQLGIAATLLITGTFFDLISDTGSDRFLIQDRHGDAVRVQQLVQLVYVGRGLMIGAALLVFAGPIALFYHTPRLAEGIAILALSPIIYGFLHLDIRRAQRAHDFRPQAFCLMAADTAGLVATVAAAWLTRNFTAVLYGVIARSAVMVLASHLVATRPYRLAWEAEHGPRLARFAAPLMINGLLLFLAQQGDRVIISNQMGVSMLGYYSVIIQLISYPSVIVGDYLHAIYIPLIAAQRDSTEGRNRVGDLLGGQTLLIGVAMAAGFALVAPPAVPILFGARFAQPAMLIGLVGILQVTRFLLNWPTTVALAMGRSTTVATSNLAHTVALGAAFVGLRLWGGLTGLVGGLIVGELAANAVALFLLARDMDRNRWQGFDRLGLFIMSAAAILGWNLVLRAESWLGSALMLAVSAAIAVLLLRREAEAIGQAVSLARRVATPLLLRPRER